MNVRLSKIRLVHTCPDGLFWLKLYFVNFLQCLWCEKRNKRSRCLFLTFWVCFWKGNVHSKKKVQKQKKVLLFLNYFSKMNERLKKTFLLMKFKLNAVFLLKKLSLEEEIISSFRVHRGKRYVVRVGKKP